MSKNNFEVLSPEKPLNNDLAEKQVIAAYLYYPNTSVYLLNPGDFYNPTWRELFNCISAIQAENKTPSNTVLMEYVKNLPNKKDKQGHIISNPTVEDIFSAEEISEPDAWGSFRENIAILKGYSKQRKVRNLLLKGLASITPGSFVDTDKVLEELSLASEDIANNSFNEFSYDLIPMTEEDIKQQLNSEGGDLHTGYFFDAKDEEDKELLIHDRALTFIAAPTSHGKSTMLENLALNILEKHPQKHILYLTYEEDYVSVFTSFLTIYCAKNNSIPSKGKIRSTIKNDLKGNSSFVATDARPRYNSAKTKFFSLIKKKSLNIRYKDYDVDKLISYIKYMKSNNACDIVFIDYMQLLTLAGNFKLSRQEQLKEICLKLKDLAVSSKYGLPIVLAAQFNRQVVNPLGLVSTNIREAGDIEQIANTIVAMWNCGFTPTSDKDASTSQLNSEYSNLAVKNPNKIYAKIIKRRGQAPNVKTMLEFDGRTGLITSKENVPSPNNEEEDIPF